MTNIKHYAVVDIYPAKEDGTPGPVPGVSPVGMYITIALVDRHDVKRWLWLESADGKFRGWNSQATWKPLGRYLRSVRGDPDESFWPETRWRLH